VECFFGELIHGFRGLVFWAAGQSARLEKTFTKRGILTCGGTDHTPPASRNAGQYRLAPDLCMCHFELRLTTSIAATGKRHCLGGSSAVKATLFCCSSFTGGPCAASVSAEAKPGPK